MRRANHLTWAWFLIVGSTPACLNRVEGSGSGGTGGAGGTGATGGSLPVTGGAGAVGSGGGGTGGVEGGGTGGSASTGCQPNSFCELLTPEQYASLFPSATTPYSYAGLVAAADDYFPEFTRVGTLDERKREAAAFLANVSHESGGFQFAEEIVCANGVWLEQWTADPESTTPCNVQRYVRDPGDGIFRSYHGRGAIQLTGLTNYQAATDDLGVDLVHDPDQVASDAELAVGTAVWFWMVRGAIHDVIVSGGGFGATVQAINGIECSSTDPVRINQWNARLQLFTSITSVLGIGVGDTSGCR